MKSCPCHPITILRTRKVVLTDKLKHPWKMDSHGYFLVKLENKMICCGFCTAQHKMVIEFRGIDPHAMAKEIAKRKVCNADNLAYISQELMIAKNCLVKKKKYVQR
jgi:hypothetical protein